MRFALDLHDPIARQRQPAALQPFLQPRLRILVALGRAIGVRIELIERRCEYPQQRRARDLDAGLEIQRPAHGLECIGEDRLAPESAGLQFAGAQRQRGTQLERGGHARQRGAADHG